MSEIFAGRNFRENLISRVFRPKIKFREHLFSPDFCMDLSTFLQINVLESPSLKKLGGVSIVFVIIGRAVEIYLENKNIHIATEKRHRGYIWTHPPTRNVNLTFLVAT